MSKGGVTACLPLSMASPSSSNNTRYPEAWQSILMELVWCLEHGGLCERLTPAAGAFGNTYEPYLSACARPDYLFPAYFEGRNLAESYYLSLLYLSWQSVVLGDPLMSLGKP